MRGRVGRSWCWKANACEEFYALHAEAMACIVAVEGLANLGAHRVILESDSQILIRALSAGDSYSADYGVLLRESRSACTATFDTFEFVFVVGRVILLPMLLRNMGIVWLRPLCFGCQRLC